VNHQQIVQCFDDLFANAFQTRLQGGAEEPLYEVRANGTATIHFRADYASSALHEVAHWCIAGPARRCLEDYGYWYRANRDRDQQYQFQCVEARPQALEWIFSVAADVPFRVSADNFDASAASREDMKAMVLAAAQPLRHATPSRARCFAGALAIVSGRSDYLCVEHYNQLPE
jgi:elongation factor P hydroxylase